MGLDPLFRSCVIAAVEGLIFQDMLVKGQSNPLETLAAEYTKAGFNQESSTKAQFFDTYVLAHRERIGWLIPFVRKIGPGRMDKMKVVYDAVKAANTPPSTTDFKKIVKVVTTPINPINLGYSIVKNKDKLKGSTVPLGDILDIIVQSYNISPREVFEMLYDEIYRGLKLSKVDTFKDLASRLPKR